MREILGQGGFVCFLFTYIYIYLYKEKSSDCVRIFKFTSLLEMVNDDGNLHSDHVNLHANTHKKQCFPPRYHY